MSASADYVDFDDPDLTCGRTGCGGREGDLPVQIARQYGYEWETMSVCGITIILCPACSLTNAHIVHDYNREHAIGLGLDPTWWDFEHPAPLGPAPPS